MLRIGFDLDGVVADFRTAFLDAATTLLGRDAIHRPSAPLPDFDAVSAADARVNPSENASRTPSQAASRA